MLWNDTLRPYDSTEREIKGFAWRPVYTIFGEKRWLRRYIVIQKFSKKRDAWYNIKFIERV